MMPKSVLLACWLGLGASAPCMAAASAAESKTDDAAYVRVTNERAEKITASLHLDDAAKATRVRDAIAGQYRGLNEIQRARDARISAARHVPHATKETIDAATKAARADAAAAVAKQHESFLAQLSTELSAAQIDQVKDGLTYGVLPLTFRVYQEMLPTLTTEQKEQIHAWLVEAREHAIDGFSSEEKHAWFGKYKGRINNYLSAAGYDMKQAEHEMMARQKAAATPAK